MKKQIYLAIIVILSTLFSIFFLDIPIATFINNNIPQNISIIKFITDFASLPYLVLINIVILLFYFKKHKKIKTEQDKLVICSTLTQILLPILLRILKFIFGRMRPFELDFNGYQQTFFFLRPEYEFSSFPSGHSYSFWVFTVCVLMAFQNTFTNKLYKYSLVSFAIIICLTRILLNVHYLSDVFFGACLGSYLASILMPYLFSKIDKITSRK